MLNFLTVPIYSFYIEKAISQKMANLWETKNEEEQQCSQTRTFWETDLEQ